MESVLSSRRITTITKVNTTTAVAVQAAIAIIVTAIQATTKAAVQIATAVTTTAIPTLIPATATTTADQAAFQ